MNKIIINNIIGFTNIQIITYTYIYFPQYFNTFVTNLIRKTLNNNANLYRWKMLPYNLPYVESNWLQANYIMNKNLINNNYVNHEEKSCTNVYSMVNVFFKNLKLRSKTQIMHMELSIAQYYTGLIRDAKIFGKILYTDNMSDGSS